MSSFTIQRPVPPLGRQARLQQLVPSLSPIATSLAWLMAPESGPNHPVSPAQLSSSELTSQLCFHCYYFF